MPKVDLFEFEGFGLIVAWKTGVTYTNQVAGYGCFHPEMERAFVPLFDDVGKPVTHALGQHFRGDWHPITAADADIVDRILHRAGFEFIATDRSKVEESYEAWIHVDVQECPTKSMPPLVGFGNQKAVLTWPNSD